jgi:thiol-disulfide isomerase/thioredoxin
MAARKFNWGTALFVLLVLIAIAALAYSALHEIGGNTPSAVPPQESPAAAASDFIVSEPAKPVPEKAFTDADGGSHKLSDYKGRYALVNFWATWCGPCKVELPSLERLKAKMGGKLAVVTISLDTDPAAAVKYLTDNHLTGLDTYADPSLDLSVLLGANELPTTVLIDPAGNVIGRHTGGTEWDSPAAIAALDKIIAKG